MMKYTYVLALLFVLSAGCGSADPTKEPNVDQAKKEITDDQFLSTESICGTSDNREISAVSEVGRLRGRSVCTGTMIGRRCFITAGHCTVRGTDDYVEFNTPVSENGKLVNASKENIYKVKRTIRERDRGKGNDYSVLQLYANSVTGQYPGDVQGHLDVEWGRPARGAVLRITGYGSDRVDTTGTRHLAQKTHDGELVSVGSSLRYVLDTTGGNSGSAIIDEITGKVIGVHTHGGCYESGGSNSGTSLYYNSRFRRAVQRCLDRYDD